MPLYEYECIPNRHRFEVRHGVHEPPVDTCPQCGGATRRVIHPVGVVFKGSGFYATDSRKSNTAAKPAESSAKEPSTSGNDSKSDAKSSGESSKSTKDD